MDLAAPAPLPGGGGLPGGGPLVAGVCTDDRTRRWPLPGGDVGARRLRPAPGARRRRRRRADRARLGRPRRVLGRAPPHRHVAPARDDGRAAPADARHRVLLLRPAQEVLVHVLLPVAAGRHGGADGRPGVHRPAVGRLVAGLRRLRRPAARQGRAARSRQPDRRHRLLPGDARRRRVERRPRGAGPAERRRRCAAAAHAVPARGHRRVHGRRAGPARRGRAHPPGSRVEIVDGAGHFLHVERPDAVGRLVLDFLAA